MFNSRSVVLGLLGLAVALLLSVGCAPVSLADAPPTPFAETDGIHVNVSAAASTTSWDERDAARIKFDLPLLYLHRQREGTEAVEHTLHISLSGLAGGSAVQIEAGSIHADVTTGEQHTQTARFVTPDRPCTTFAPCTLHWTLDAATTPSDLYTLRLLDDAGQVLWSNPTPERPAFAALDTWDVELDDYTVRVTYATLFPFARGQEGLEERLPPAAVTDFIAGQFAPLIADTWQTQVEEWGFGPLHPDWDPDRVVEVIVTDPPYALFGGTGTYSRSLAEDGGLYPERRIWWHATNNSFQAYDSLESAYKAVFAHEFFHLMQWNVLLSYGEALSVGEASAGQPLSTEQPTRRWRNLFIEAQGKFAPSVQYPEIELGKELGTREDREYAGAANRFLLQRLNSSYRELEADRFNKYDAALYWRFLYERYGDMGIIRAALEEMARHYSPEIVGAMDRAMDAAFVRTDGPFQSFEESLVAFARANYALRLESRDCTAAGLAECAGLYEDPHNVYASPPLEAELDYDGAGLVERGFTPTSSGMEFEGFSDPNTASSEPDTDDALTYSGAIPASYGMDFIELHLDPTAHGQPLTVRFQGEGAVARFNVQIWKLGLGAESFKPRAVTAAPEVVSQGEDGAHVYAIPSLDTETYDRLTLIITRLDSEELADPAGGYQVTLESTGVPAMTVLSSK